MQALLRILPFRGFLLECTLIKAKQLTCLSVLLEGALSLRPLNVSQTKQMETEIHLTPAFAH